MRGSKCRHGLSGGCGGTELDLFKTSGGQLFARGAWGHGALLKDTSAVARWTAPPEHEHARELTWAT